ncbi:migration and invasion-inhibitory protein isoform X1 [Ascaphus truei]|uniref:migration and invasion-inhibitory protein isoform X1 n=1 Tax=Ascaphus truei TaxID=8439 RepID=UPI003F5A844F
MPGRASAARKALCNPIKATQVCRQTPGHSALSQQKVLQGRSLREKKSSTRGRVPNDVVLVQSPEKQACHLNSSEILSQPCTEDKTCDTKPQQYLDRLLDKGNTRHTEAKTPKSILVTPMNKDVKRDAGRVTFLSSNADSTTEYCSAHPFLGYDVIAGLLEITSPISDKSEQFFSDINEFRRVNKEECVHEYYAESEAPDFSASEDEMDLSPDSHQCVYCYRVNSRLFTTPMRLESACPVCKRRRSRRHSTLEEPAYIRVSIPRSTLLPPYKYKAHRRKSFDPTDSLALPSHCLAGWENAVPSCDFNISSLDLKTSLELNTATSVEIGQSNTNHVPHDVSQGSSNFFSLRPPAGSSPLSAPTSYLNVMTSHCHGNVTSRDLAASLDTALPWRHV